MGAVRDDFEIEELTLVGVAFGGCLVLRAATAMTRVERGNAYDVLTNLFAIYQRQTHALLRALLKVLLRLRPARIVNWTILRVARKTPIVQWRIQQVLHVTGATHRLNYLNGLSNY